MSSYKDVYRDLPSRVYEIWQRTMDQSNRSDRDLTVTAMLMAAAAGMAMPFENLKDVGIGNGKRWNEHPAFSHVKQRNFNATLRSCNDFLIRPMIECIGLKAAVLMHCQKLSGVREAAKSERGDASLDISKHDVRFAVKILRNALAHNNIFDIPNAQEEIEKLVFFSKSNGWQSCDGVVGWHVLVITVAEFKTFLTAWFYLLREEDSFVAAAQAVVSEDAATSETHGQQE